MTESGSGLLAATAGWAMEGLEAAGVLVILAGALVTGAGLLRDLVGGDAAGGYERYRRRFGRTLLVGLELLVAADIIGTVVSPLDVAKLAALGLVVAIRTLLSLSIEVEITGRWPWRSGGTARD
jgi:uncharacterized membrane protein